MNFIKARADAILVAMVIVLAGVGGLPQVTIGMDVFLSVTALVGGVVGIQKAAEFRAAGRETKETTP